MSVDLVNENDSSFWTNNRAWYRILSLALMYGWKPAGTLRPPDWDDHPRLKDEIWDGGYATNDGQIVTDVDALAMAAALEESLVDIPEQKPQVAMGAERTKGNVAEVLLQEIEVIHQAVHSGVRDPTAIGVYEIYKVKLNELIDFCREGEFRIY